MRSIVNSREMQQYDKNTTEHFGIPSLVLMERAAVAFVDVLLNRGLDVSKALIVCGTGNNGGDGLAAARLLFLKGSAVTVVLAGDASKATEQNRRQQDILRAYGVEILAQIPEREQYSMIIDALFGIGLSRGISGSYAGLIGKINAMDGFKAAVDIPSGISADDGRVQGCAFAADLTVTFGYEKVGMLLWPGNEYAGETVTADIGINERSWLGQKPRVSALEDGDCLTLAKRPGHSNKGTFGKLLVIAGCAGMAGAAFLCARAAYAAGCGLVRILSPEENRTVLQAGIPEAVVTAYTADNPDMGLVNEALGWADAIVCGPGIGVSGTAGELVRCALSQKKAPVLFDADALNLLAEDMDCLRRMHPPLVLTPHLGEMSRLCKEPVSAIQKRLTVVAEEMARQYNVVCVLKDEHTVTGTPDGRLFINLSGNAGMATAGSGDVLSGVTGSLMAQGMRAEEAAPYGVYLHGRAGDFMLPDTGKNGLMAGDLILGLRRFWAGLLPET